MRSTIKAFRMLSDETRLRILNILSIKESCVCEVMQALEITQSKASRGLTALYDAGFLKFRKDGLWTLYSLNDEGIKDYQVLLVEAVQKALHDNANAAQDKERLKQAKRVGTSCVSRELKQRQLSANPPV